MLRLRRALEQQRAHLSQYGACRFGQASHLRVPGMETHTDGPERPNIKRKEIPAQMMHVEITVDMWQIALAVALFINSR